MSKAATPSEATQPTVEDRPQPKKAAVLIVEDHAPFARTLAHVLKDVARTWIAPTASEALALAARHRIDVAFIDITLAGDIDGITLLERLRNEYPDLEAIICSVDQAVPTVVRAMRAGAWDYTTKAICSLDGARLLVARAMERQRERRELAFFRSEAAQANREVVAAAPAMAEALRTLELAAPTQSTVFLTGESGTGKEVMARRLHLRSARAEGPFVAVNLAAIPRELAESTLFGHERGAFTGAVERHLGLFERADGGTLFLDEIGELDRSLQAKLLRVLQERQLVRVGGTETIDFDVRLVAATNVDLAAAVRAGTFREDLYYRLHVVPIRLPPLRDRREDIPMLIQVFARRFRNRGGKRPLLFAPAALAALLAYPWPGNIRELENLVERMTVVCPGDLVEESDLPIEYRLDALAAGERKKPNGNVLDATCEAVERTFIVSTLRRCNGNRRRAAQELGLAESSLHYKLNKYGIS